MCFCKHFRWDEDFALTEDFVIIVLQFDLSFFELSSIFTISEAQVHKMSEKATTQYNFWEWWRNLKYRDVIKTC